MQTRFHTFFSALISLGLLIAVQIFARPIPVFRFLVPAFIVFLVLTAIYNYYYLKKQDKFNTWVWLRPLLFFIAWFGLFFIIPSEFLRGLFLLVGLVLVYYIEYFLYNTGEQVLFNQILLSGFTFFVAVFGLSWYFHIWNTFYLAIVFSFILLLCRCAYEFTPRTDRQKWIGSLILALFSTELFWSLGYLPLHYSALGVIAFALFYFAWALYYFYLYNHLTTRKFQFHTLLSTLMIIAMVIVSPNRIIV